LYNRFMDQEKINQFKALLDEMVGPDLRQFGEITSHFNRFKDINNPNTRPTRIKNQTLVGFALDKFYDFQHLLKIRESFLTDEVDFEYRKVVSNFLICYFYEIVFVIRTHDAQGWSRAGFTLTPEDMHLLKEYRNIIFHVPDDLELLEERLQKFKEGMDGVLAKVFGQSKCLNDYFLLYRDVYPELYLSFIKRVQSLEAYPLRHI